MNMGIYPPDTHPHWLRAASEAVNYSLTSRLTGSAECHWGGREVAGTRRVWVPMQLSSQPWLKSEVAQGDVTLVTKGVSYSALCGRVTGFQEQSFLHWGHAVRMPRWKALDAGCTHGTWPTTSCVACQGSGTEGEVCSRSNWNARTKANRMETLPLCTSFVRSLLLKFT